MTKVLIKDKALLGGLGDKIVEEFVISKSVIGR
jgi:hypothetical protein